MWSRRSPQAPPPSSHRAHLQRHGSMASRAVAGQRWAAFLGGRSAVNRTRNRAPRSPHVAQQGRRVSAVRPIPSRRTITATAVGWTELSSARRPRSRSDPSNRPALPESCSTNELSTATRHRRQAAAPSRVRRCPRPCAWRADPHRAVSVPRAAGDVLCDVALAACLEPAVQGNHRMAAAVSRAHGRAGPTS